MTCHEIDENENVREPISITQRHVMESNRWLNMYVSDKIEQKISAGSVHTCSLFICVLIEYYPTLPQSIEDSRLLKKNTLDLRRREFLVTKDGLWGP